MNKKFQSLKKPSLSKEVEQHLRHSINSGAYKPGDKLPSERELVEQFQVSRVTVRDGLKNLQNLGLVRVERGVNAGAYISEPTPLPITQSFENLIQMKKVSFSDLIEIRLYIEPNVSAAAAAQHTSEDIDRLHDLLDRAEGQAGTSHKEARMINVQFHNEVAKINGNPIIVFLSQSITQVFSALLIEKTQHLIDEKTIVKLVSDHRSILKAITEQDPVAAFERTRGHLIEAYEMYSKVIPCTKNEPTNQRINLFQESAIGIHRT